jgi:uncharacterized RDD family membrane protein YckC
VPPGGWYQPLQQSAPWAGRLAGWGTRLGAYFLDALIVALPGAIVIIALAGGVTATADHKDAGYGILVGALVVGILAFIAVALLYAPMLMSRDGERNGQTLGKQWLGIRVIRTNGQPFTFWPAALREIVLKGLAVGVASSIIPVIPWFLNYLWPLWDEQNRALHDMAADTRVVAA